MAIERRIRKDGGVYYYDLERGRFASRGEFIRENAEEIGKGPRKRYQLDELNPKERNVFQGVKNADRKFRYNGKFLDNATSKTLAKMGFKGGEMEGKISEAQLEAIQTSPQIFEGQSWFRDGERYETQKGDVLATAPLMLLALDKGGTITVEIDGGIYRDQEAIAKLQEWELENTPDGEKFRVTHQMFYDPQTKSYYVNLGNTVIEEMGDSPLKTV